MGLNIQNLGPRDGEVASLTIADASPLVLWTNPKAAKRIKVTTGSHDLNLRFLREWEQAARDGWEHRIALHTPEPEVNGPLTEAGWFLDHVAHLLKDGDAAGLTVPRGDFSPWTDRWVEIVRARLDKAIMLVLL